MDVGCWTSDVVGCWSMVFGRWLLVVDKSMVGWWRWVLWDEGLWDEGRAYAAKHVCAYLFVQK